ncbi:MAG: threonylcarbamoyl-AMP synthase [Parcubacteria group bacterium]|nr:threonylcarbamoyl-AMP synthase [Parcubacteria group bacterium]
MKIVKINENTSQANAIEAIVNFLEQGRVVVLPTDTSYGLCANADDEKAVRKVFTIKERSADKPLSVIVRDLSMLAEVAELGEKQSEIIEKYLPGPFTFVLPKKAVISNIVSGGGDTVGVRMPDHPLIQQIMAKVDFPLTATSANISGGQSMYSVQDIVKEFAERELRPGLVFDAGELSPNKPSTIVDLTCDPPRILREGSGEFKL